MSIWIVGRIVHGDAQIVDRFTRALHGIQGRSETNSSIDPGGLKTYGLGEFRDSIGKPPHLHKEQSQVVMGRRRLRVEPNGLPKLRKRIVVVDPLSECKSQAQMHDRRIGRT